MGTQSKVSNIHSKGTGCSGLYKNSGFDSPNSGSALARLLPSGNASGLHYLDFLRSQGGDRFVAVEYLALLSTIKVIGFSLIFIWTMGSWGPSLTEPGLSYSLSSSSQSRGQVVASLAQWQPSGLSEGGTFVFPVWQSLALCELI